MRTNEITCPDVAQDTVTDEDITSLQEEAGAHGDLGTVALCERALAGDDAARVQCERFIQKTRTEAAS